MAHNPRRAHTVLSTSSAFLAACTTAQQLGSGKEYIKSGVLHRPGSPGAEHGGSSVAHLGCSFCGTWLSRLICSGEYRNHIRIQVHQGRHPRTPWVRYGIACHFLITYLENWHLLPFVYNLPHFKPIPIHGAHISWYSKYSPMGYSSWCHECLHCVCDLFDIFTKA